MLRLHVSRAKGVQKDQVRNRVIGPPWQVRAA